jgi:hypothetical protein
VNGIYNDLKFLIGPNSGGESWLLYRDWHHFLPRLSSLDRYSTLPPWTQVLSLTRGLQLRSDAFRLVGLSGGREYAFKRKAKAADQMPPRITCMCRPRKRAQCILAPADVIASISSSVHAVLLNLAGSSLLSKYSPFFASIDPNS